METSRKKDARPIPSPRSVLFAQAPHGATTIGVVSNAEPSSLSLLAAGVAGMAARRARRERTKTK